MAGILNLTSATSEGNTHLWGRFVGVGMCSSPGKVTILSIMRMSIGKASRRVRALIEALETEGAL
jgi:hypothetical protein